MRGSAGRGMRAGDTGFTLIELLIVLAVIGIIAAIAIPGFVKMKTKSKTAVIGSDFHTVQHTAILYNSDFNTFPHDTNPGEYPPEFKDYLGKGFDFAAPDPLFQYDWENWTGLNGNPDDGGSGVAIGFTVHTSDPDLGAQILRRYSDIVKLTQPNAYTFVIQPTS